MLILIVFWLAIVLSLISWIGGLSEMRPSLMTAAAVFLGFALLAAVADGVAWL